MRQFFGVVVFGRRPPAGRRVDFFFYGPTGKLEAGLVGKLRTRTSDQVLYATVRRSRVHFEQRPGRWRLLVRVGALSRSWRFRIR